MSMSMFEAIQESRRESGRELGKIKRTNFRGSMEACQSIIDRMATNSRSIKFFFVAIILGLSFLEKRPGPIFLSLLFFPYLDAFYLRQERIFRFIYKELSNWKRKPFDFSLPKKKLGFFRNLYFDEFFSISVWPFYFLTYLLFFYGV